MRRFFEGWNFNKVKHAKLPFRRRRALNTVCTKALKSPRPRRNFEAVAAATAAAARGRGPGGRVRSSRLRGERAAPGPENKWVKNAVGKFVGHGSSRCLSAGARGTGKTEPPVQGRRRRVSQRRDGHDDDYIDVDVPMHCRFRFPHSGALLKS